MTYMINHYKSTTLVSTTIKHYGNVLSIVLTNDVFYIESRQQLSARMDIN
jgi:hypothetical protein